MSANRNSGTREVENHAAPPRWMGIVPLLVLLLSLGWVGSPLASDSQSPGPAGPGVWTLAELLATGPPPDEDVAVIPLGRTATVSVQLVWVKTEVRRHRHEIHTETVTILGGEGVFTLGDHEYPAEPGDVFLVPPGTPHAFVSSGDRPAAAVTTFSPAFDGKDRVWMDGP